MRCGNSSRLFIPFSAEPPRESVFGSISRFITKRELLFVEFMERDDKEALAPTQGHVGVEFGGIRIEELGNAFFCQGFFGLLEEIGGTLTLSPLLVNDRKPTETKRPLRLFR